MGTPAPSPEVGPGPRLLNHMEGAMRGLTPLVAIAVLASLAGTARPVSAMLSWRKRCAG